MKLLKSFKMKTATEASCNNLFAMSECSFKFKAYYKIFKSHTIVVWNSSCDLGPLDGVHPQAVVPVTSRHKVLVVRRENKKFVGYFKVVSKRPSNVVPPRPKGTEKV